MTILTRNIILYMANVIIEDSTKEAQDEELTEHSLFELLNKTTKSDRAVKEKTGFLSIPGYKQGEIMIGKLINSVGITVDYEGNPAGKPLAALSTCAINDSDIDRDVAISFESGDPYRPIIIGFIYHSFNEKETNEKPEHINCQLDGKSIKLTGNKEIILRCGEASITLTKAGKVIIRGAYILTRSSGVNSIKGGSVQIN